MNINGTEIVTKKVRFHADQEAGGEQWSQYVLEDGTVLRLKVVLCGVRRAEGVLDGFGKPVYQLEHQIVSGTELPE